MTGSGGGLGQLLGRPAAVLGHTGKPGNLQVSFCSFIVFVFCFYLIFCHCFEFKTIQTMPKTPLNIFILLDGLFQKLIKYLRGI